MRPQKELIQTLSYIEPLSISNSWRLVPLLCWQKTNPSVRDACPLKNEFPEEKTLNYLWPPAPDFFRKFIDFLKNRRPLWWQRLYGIEGLNGDYPRTATTGPSVMLTEKNAAGCQLKDGLLQLGGGREGQGRGWTGLNLNRTNLHWDPTFLLLLMAEISI